MKRLRFEVLAVLLFAVTVQAQDAQVIPAGGPQLVMTADQIKTFSDKAPRTVRSPFLKPIAASAKKQASSVTPATQRRNQPTTDIVTPGPGLCGFSQEEADTATRWCKSMGYEWLCGRGDFVHRWHLRVNSGQILDPAVMAAEEGFDSPAVDCDYEYKVERQRTAVPGGPLLPTWPQISIWRNGVEYRIAVTADSCKFLEGGGGQGDQCTFILTAPCVNEKQPSTWAWSTSTSRTVPPPAPPPVTPPGFGSYYVILDARPANGVLKSGDMLATDFNGHWYVIAKGGRADILPRGYRVVDTVP